MVVCDSYLSAGKSIGTGSDSTDFAINNCSVIDVESQVIWGEVEELLIANKPYKLCLLSIMNHKLVYVLLSREFWSIDNNYSGVLGPYINLICLPHINIKLIFNNL